jgi:hypothetical protein
MLQAWLPDLVVLELVGAAPGQGNASGFAFGHAAGVLEGVASCGAWRVERVPASVWKPAYRLAGGAAQKGQSVSLCAKLVGTRIPEGPAEAVLLAWYGARHRC